MGIADDCFFAQLRESTPDQRAQRLIVERGPPRASAFLVATSLPEVRPDAARAFAISQFPRCRFCAWGGRTIAFSTRLPRAGSLAAANCASPFRSDSNSRR